MSNIEKTLIDVRNTLDCLNVHGKQNCGMVYGCIDAIDKILIDIKDNKIDIVEDDKENP